MEVLCPICNWYRFVLTTNYKQGSYSILFVLSRLCAVCTIFKPINWLLTKKTVPTLLPIPAYFFCVLLPIFFLCCVFSTDRFPFSLCLEFIELIDSLD